jgi:hypothetical protein
MERASKSNRALARLLVSAFGGQPTVRRYWDDPRQSYVDVARLDAHPDPGLTAYATLGLSDYPLIRDGREYPARVEFVGVARTEWTKFPNILATAAFCVINSNWFAMPGRIFPNVVTIHQRNLELKHVLFVSPFLWEGELETVTFPDKTVAWLMAVPISDREAEYARRNGSEALETLMEEKEVNDFDPDRPSLI